MKSVVVFLAIIAAVIADGPLAGGLRVKFNMGPGIGTDFFFAVPQTVSNAIAEGWSKLERPAGVALPQLDMYCYNDRIVCLFYDDLEFVAGLQVAIPEDEYTGYPFGDYTSQGFSRWTPVPAAGQSPRTYRTLQQFFVSEETLKVSKEERLANRNPSRLLQEGGVWVTGTNSELLKIADNQADIENSVFTTQACIPWMGQHYYYKMTPETQCTAEGVYPWFPLVHSGELVGTGFMTFGLLPIHEGQRDWFERPAKAEVQMIVPSGSECLYELAGKGVITMHIYYVNEPNMITC